MNAALEVRDLTKRYGRALALDAVSLTLDIGASTALIGVNGAGKSTLFRCLLDLQGIDAGVVRILGTDHREPRARVPLAWLPERFVPPAYATGREVLAQLCDLHGVAYHEDAALAECRALDLAAEALTSRTGTYSKGMAQKLGLIACLLAQRPLLLLDEPMSGLDPLAHELFRRRLARLKETGTTLFFSTHALADAQALCESLVWLDAGRVRYAGPVSALAGTVPTGILSDAFISAVRHPPP
ncbi:MAG: ABC transporter ATP-binding protein [Gammaproteobacteria bacterium]|nr:ABC transporter ATP-binding protein [Gammaproteobacteria bacterium]